ncbi:MAG: ABC-2 family transporter protein [Candidatus Doudnabacteria bacterium]|nr:ABC-2 family transporter protein [Candidatus Doudnabacteria bacterium]
MRKYLAILSTQIQNSFQYRGQLFFWVIVEVFFLGILFFLWQAIFTGKETVGEYTFANLMTYYISVFLVEMIASSYNEYNMEEIVRDGKLNKYIIRPMSFFWYRLSSDLGWKVSKLVVTLPVFAAVLFLFRKFLIIPSFEAGARFLVVLIPAAFLYFLVSYLTSFAAFWMLRINAVVRIVREISLPLLAGSLIPLDLFPGFLQELTKYLPFRYLIFFPVKVLLGQVSGEEFVFGIVVTILWVGILSLAVYLLWTPALKRYESVGG